MVRVEDSYGNARESAVYCISTNKSFTIGKVERKADSQAPMHLNSDIYRSDDNYLVRLKATKPVSICGELAADKNAIPKLLNLGMETHSVSPKSIAQTKEEIRDV